MGKSWDDFEPKEFQEFSQKWGEQALRVLKPGGYLLAFCGTRTYHRMVVGLEDAGFTIKDQIDWLYGQGFPKSHNIKKALMYLLDDEGKVVGEEEVDVGIQSGSMHAGRDSEIEKREVKEPTDERIKKWQGWGTALKPAHEPIVVAQKPYENTYAENVLKYGVGGLNIDGCRIGFDDKEPDNRVGVNDHQKGASKNPFDSGNSDFKNTTYKQGRWPANVVLDPQSAEMLDRQSGNKKGFSSGGERTGGFNSKYVNGDSFETNLSCQKFNDEGGASRFFKTVKRAKAFKNEDGERDFQNRMYYSAKAHKSERNAGLEDLEDREGFTEKTNKTRNRDMYSMAHYCKICGNRKDSCSCDNPEYEIKEQEGRKKDVKNDIATLKPINLMRWLCRLVTPEDGTVLDPFAGSGTTGCAAEVEGFDYILIEKRERFANVIAPKRCDYWSDPSNWGELKEHEEVPDPKELRNGKLSEFH